MIPIPCLGNLIDSVLTKHGLPVQTQGHNIRTYSEYLLERAKSFAATKVDYVKGGEGRLRRLTVDKGLLRETESVQDQIRALVKCEVQACYLLM
jgi:phosphatidylinositol-binding clathrin assembly protein